MGGPIVRTGTTPAFWENWDKAFGGKRGAAATKQTAGKKTAAKKPAKAVKSAKPKATKKKTKKKK
jgi:hypothetical protein